MGQNKVYFGILLVLLLIFGGVVLFSSVDRNVVYTLDLDEDIVFFMNSNLDIGKLIILNNGSLPVKVDREVFICSQDLISPVVLANFEREIGSLDFERINLQKYIYSGMRYTLEEDLVLDGVYTIYIDKFSPNFCDDVDSRVLGEVSINFRDI